MPSPLSSLLSDLPSEDLYKVISVSADLRKLTLLSGYEHGKGATQKDIKAAEKVLKVTFPIELRLYLASTGWVKASGRFALFGLGKDVPDKLNIVKMALKWQQHRGGKLPKGLLPLAGETGGNAAVLDLRAKSPTYGQVLYYGFKTHRGEYRNQLWLSPQWKSYIEWLKWEADTALFTEEEEKVRNPVRGEGVYYGA